MSSLGTVGVERWKGLVMMVCEEAILASEYYGSSQRLGARALHG
jgi:hypothetical protein